jgi:uncharacterized protein YpuA (DUF1002 family)
MVNATDTQTTSEGPVFEDVVVEESETVEESEVVEDTVTDVVEDTTEDVVFEDTTEEVKEEVEEEVEFDAVTTIGPVTGNVVTLGENLTEDQRALMYEYFGVSPEEVYTIIVTHEDEVRYMEGIATAEQIGATTNSCSFVEPTKSGGIKVKTANLNYVTSDMIASTLATAGMENCNVVAACPFEVSGTGALTGIIMAYESASGEVLDEGKKEAAMEEMILLGDLAAVVGEETATELMNIAKTEIIDKGITDPAEIGAIVDEVAADYGVTLTEDQKAQIVQFLQLISQYDYDLAALSKTLDNLSETVSGLKQTWANIKSFFFGSDDGILSQTNDEVLGANVITDSTVEVSKYAEGLFTRIMNMFSGE